MDKLLVGGEQLLTDPLILVGLRFRALMGTLKRVSLLVELEWLAHEPPSVSVGDDIECARIRSGFSECELNNGSFARCSLENKPNRFLRPLHQALRYRTMLQGMLQPQLALERTVALANRSFFVDRQYREGESRHKMHGAPQGSD